MKKGIKVLAAISGGVDSSTLAILLKQNGFDVTGVTFIINKEWENEHKSIVESVYKQLDIPHFYVDVTDDFNRNVVEHYEFSLNQGITPSPCPRCNKVFKFDILYKLAMEKGFDFIATGHYAQIVELNGSLCIKKGVDVSKDQSYMLYALESEILASVKMPLGIYNKKEIREIAIKNGISTAERPDSQGLCFALKGYKDFIENSERIILKPGYLTDKSGSVLGVHKGYQLYTIGQRRGLGVSNDKILFVTDIIADENRIILGDFEDLKHSKIVLSSVTFSKPYIPLDDTKLYTARPRFSSSGHDAYCSFGTQTIVTFKEPNAECTPGQHLVLYDGGYVVGGGIIESFL